MVFRTEKPVDVVAIERRLQARRVQAELLKQQKKAEKDETTVATTAVDASVSSNTKPSDPDSRAEKRYLARAQRGLRSEFEVIVGERVLARHYQREMERAMKRAEKRGEYERAVEAGPWC